MSGVLDGLKVLDLSWGIAGPMTGMLLADHGADVTRIERPQGDPFPDMLGYKVWHRGKKNAVLDFHTVGNLGLFKKLVADADVLIESMRPGKMKQFGLDYEQLAKLNPRLIYCSITGYGEDDKRPGYDALVAATSGLQYEQRGWAEGALNHMAGREDPFAGAVEIDPNHVQGANREARALTRRALTHGLWAVLHRKVISNAKTENGCIIGCLTHALFSKPPKAIRSMRRPTSAFKMTLTALALARKSSS